MRTLVEQGIIEAAAASDKARFLSLSRSLPGGLKAAQALVRRRGLTTRLGGCCLLTGRRRHSAPLAVRRTVELTRWARAAIGRVLDVMDDGRECGGALYGYVGRDGAVVIEDASGLDAASSAWRTSTSVTLLVEARRHDQRARFYAAMTRSSFETHSISVNWGRRSPTRARNRDRSR
jgi:hypothetical protein